MLMMLPLLAAAKRFAAAIDRRVSAVDQKTYVSGIRDQCFDANQICFICEICLHNLDMPTVFYTQCNGQLFQPLTSTRNEHEVISTCGKPVRVDSTNA